MSIFRGSNIGNFTRGGQTTIHYLRMIWQVVVQFSRLCLILFVLAIATTYWVKTTPLERSLAVGYIEAYVKYEGLKIDDATVSTPTVVAGLFRRWVSCGTRKFIEC